MGQGKTARRGPGTKIAACIVAAGSTAVTQPCALAQTPPPLGYNLKTVSLTGPGYEFTSAGGISRGAGFGPGPANAAGIVSGSSGRVSASGVSLGGDAWIFNGTSSSVIGLSG